MRIVATAFWALFCLFPQLAESAPQNPLVLVPGILGSKLCNGTEVVWGTRSSLSNLSRLEIGGASEEKIQPCGILTTVQILGPLWTNHYYDGLLSTLKGFGYEDGKNLFIFTYDWRRSNFDSAEQLKQFVRSKIPVNQKFDIVAHSMGGIVTRIMLTNNAERARVRKIVYLGTPFLGSANTLGTLSVGWGAIENTMIGGMETIQRVVLSWPGFLELLPRYQNCCRLRTKDNKYRSLNVLDANVWLSNQWLPAGLQGGNRFKQFRADLDRVTKMSPILAADTSPGIEEFLIAGEGHLTRHRFGVLEGRTKPSADNWVFRKESGDGTVPIWSAARDSDQLSIGSAMPSFAEHANIFDDKWVQSTLARLLTEIRPDDREPISSRSRPVIRAVFGGTEVLWTVDAVDFAAASPTVRKGDVVDLSLTIRLDRSAIAVAGGFAPAIVRNTAAGQVLLNVNETTSTTDIAAGLLTYSSQITAAEAGEIMSIEAQIAPGYTASQVVLVLE